MVIGLGDESVLETSVTLHRTYGVPYIPGSALKGLAANYARQRLGAAWQKDSEAYKAIFGETDNAGYIIFFDALYIPGTGYQKQALYPDVITVHHPKYYQDAKNPKAPADWDSPIPIPFLSATGTYLIALAAPELQQPTEWINTTFLILENALKTMGIGAKTSSGYGYFTDFEPRVSSSEKGHNSKKVTPSPEPYVRPNILKPKEGQKLAGIVLDPKKNPEALKYIESGQASACLRYKDRELPTKMLLMVIPAEYVDAKNWSPGNTKNCIFLREEIQGNCTVWICRP